MAPSSITPLLGASLAFAALLLVGAWRRMARRQADSLARRVSLLEDRLARLESPPARRPRLRPKAAAKRGPEVRVDPPEPPTEPTLIAVPNLAATAPEPELVSAAAAEMARRFHDVWALADAGEDPDAIARASGQPVGQVELILGLRPSRGPGPS